MRENYLFLIVLIVTVFSCSKSIDEIETEVCNFTDINLSEGDSIAVVTAQKDYYWKGFEDDHQININYEFKVGNFNEIERFSFIIKKESCLKVEYAYKFYDGKFYDISALTAIEIVNFSYQTYEPNKLLTGFVTFIDPHNKQTITKKFWVNLKKSPAFSEPLLFKDCIANQLPLTIDMNNDGIIDFTFDALEDKNITNQPNFSSFKIHLKSNLASNAILSPKKNNPPYFVVFEAPFTSQNTQQYLSDVKDELDVFYEFVKPFEGYNFWLNNSLTYSEILSNSKVDYYLVSVRQGTSTYYGWIKFRFLSRNCQIQVLETYLHPIANQHISVN